MTVRSYSKGFSSNPEMHRSWDSGFCPSEMRFDESNST
jgi:hypothetical protein